MLDDIECIDFSAPHSGSHVFHTGFFTLDAYFALKAACKRTNTCVRIDNDGETTVTVDMSESGWPAEDFNSAVKHSLALRIKDMLQKYAIPFYKYDIACRQTDITCFGHAAKVLMLMHDTFSENEEMLSKAYSKQFKAATIGMPWDCLTYEIVKECSDEILCVLAKTSEDISQAAASYDKALKDLLDKHRARCNEIAHTGRSRIMHLSTMQSIAIARLIESTAARSDDYAQLKTEHLLGSLSKACALDND